MKKRTMEKENQAEERRKKILMEIAGTVVVLTVIVSIGLSHLGTDKQSRSWKKQMYLRWRPKFQILRKKKNRRQRTGRTVRCPKNLRMR